MMKILKWIVIVLLALILVPLTIGFLYQTGASISDRELRNTPPGELIDIDGVQVHLNCTGSGDATILLEAGGLSFSTNWTVLQQDLAQRYRVCSYDRPGLGFSDELEGYDLANSTLPLRLMETNGEEGPYILVGHSLGAVLIRRLAALASDQVAGLVFIDAGPPGPYANLSKELQSYFAEGEQASHMLPTLARFGIMRLTFNTDDLGPDFPTEAGAVVKSFYSKPGHLSVGASEFRRADELAIAAEALQSTTVPILSIMGAYEHNPVDGHVEAGRAYHTALADLTSGSGKLSIFEDVGHFDFLGEAEAVTRLSREIDALVAETQAGG